MKIKICHYAIIAAFVLPLIVVGTWSLLGERPTWSESENRSLEAMPQFSLSALLNDAFVDSFERHYSDTFPLRDFMMGVNRDINRFYYFNPFATSGPEGDVVLFIHGAGSQIAEGGEALPPPEGMLFPSPSPTDAQAIMPPANAAVDAVPDEPEHDAPEPEPEPPPLPELEDREADLNAGAIIIVGDRAMEILTLNPFVLTLYADVINRYAAAMPDAQVISLVTPNGGAFYAPAELRTGAYDQQAIINEMYGQLDEGVVSVDVYATMRPHVEEYLFFRTDHHWTQLGAYYAYAAFCETLGFDIVPLDEFDTGEIPNFVGSMYSFTAGYPQSAVLRQNPDTVHWWRPMREHSARVFWGTRVSEGGGYEINVVTESTTAANKYLIFTAGDNPLIHITTDVGNGRKIVVLKESYGNAFVPFLVNHYDEIFVIDPRKFNGTDLPYLDLAAFVAAYEIDDVLVINYPMVLSGTGYIDILNAVLR